MLGIQILRTKILQRLNFGVGEGKQMWHFKKHSNPATACLLQTELLVHI